MNEYNKEHVLKSILKITTDIDKNIDELLKARINKNSEEEGKALFKMEGMMVASLQEFSRLYDYINDNVK